uniref:NADP-dependent oxidoreductase domain-containing protein n=1 Tax=Oryza barthii TaxID=65489 RepID=A0A0D3HA65_9ORYZ
MAAAAGLSPRLVVTPGRRSHSHGRRRMCCAAAAAAQGERKTTVRSKEGDAVELCRVVNGMWQVSGPSWGRYETPAAVDAMLRYADGGLSTFDMADISRTLLSPAAPPVPRRGVVRPARCSGGGGAAAVETAASGAKVCTVSNRGDSLAICRVLNGMWQTSGGWGRIDRDAAVDAMLAYADAGLSTFDMADHYGPAEDLYGLFINRVRRERPPELLEEIKGLTKWVPPPVKMTRSYVEDNINRSRKRMDVSALDMLQFHWWDYANPGYLDALKHITDLKEEGKIKTVALTNFDTDRLQIILENGIPIVSNQMVDAWGGWSLFQALLQTLKKVSLKHGVSISTVAVRYILNQTSVAGSMVGVRLGLSEHIKDTNAIFSLELDEDDMNSITEASNKGRNLMDIIGDCGDEYRA